MTTLSTSGLTGTPSFEALVDICRPRARHLVYPSYLMSRIKRALGVAENDPEQIIKSIGAIETIGDCRYAMTVTDFNGTEYEITVGVKK
ncbi:MAG: hypothetical protein KGL39_04790 [Patescibacteria group bacterium]|nr:hypothetical protein [Patescibacteria group bacterium]